MSRNVAMTVKKEKNSISNKSYVPTKVFNYNSYL